MVGVCAFGHVDLSIFGKKMNTNANFCHLLRGLLSPVGIVCIEKQRYSLAYEQDC